MAPGALINKNVEIESSAVLAMWHFFSAYETNVLAACLNATDIGFLHFVLGLGLLVARFPQWLGQTDAYLLMRLREKCRFLPDVFTQAEAVAFACTACHIADTDLNCSLKYIFDPAIN